MGLLDIPTEVLVLIFEYFDLRDLLRCSLICKRVNIIIENDPTLQYFIELTVAGYIPNYSIISRRSTRNLLDEFTELCSTRKYSAVDLNFDNGKKVELPNEVVNWKYAGGYAVWLYYDSSAAGEFRNEGRRVDVYSEKFLTNGGPTWSWRSENVSYRFNILPDADLFLAVTRSDNLNVNNGADLHLLSLTTGVPHPGVDLPSIHIPATAAIGQDIQIVGDVALISCSEDVDHDERRIIIYIVNWRCGLVTHKMQTTSTYARCCKACLVTPEIVLLGIPRQGRHELAFGMTCASIGVYSCKLSEKDKELLMEDNSKLLHPKLVASFALPSVYRNSRLNAFNIISSPVVDRLALRTSASSRSPYTVPANIQLIAMSTNYTINNLTLCYTFFTPVTTFLNYKSHESSFSDTDDEHTILYPWEAWGPSMTRCLFTSRISVNTYGWRIALEDRILDFNPLDIARDRLLAANGYPEYLSGIILESTVIPCGQLFYSDVVTSLPYRESAFRQPLGPTVGPIYFDDQELLVLRDTRGYISMHVVDITYIPLSWPAFEASLNREKGLDEEE